MQGNNEKVPSFATRLEGTLNQIRLQCPRRMTDLEVQQNLKDHLFHRVKKHICNSIWYLYSTPGTPYLQLMVTAHKVESENKEIWDKVKARATVATDLGEGMAELGQQIARLMAALAKAGQVNNPSSALSSPWERGCGRGWNGSITPNHPNSQNGRSGPGQTNPSHSLPTGCGTGGNEMWSNGQSNQGTGPRREGTANAWDPNSLQSFRCQGWGHMARECPTPASAIKQPGGTEGMWLIPCQWKLPQSAVGPVHSHPNPRQWPASLRAARWTGPRETAPAIPFLNPDPVASLVGWSNEDPAIVDGQKVTALIDSGAQV